MNEKGFTLIELIMIIVILGILAVTAIPKFIDLSTEANEAALDGVVGTMAAASAINYAGCAAVDNSSASAKCTQVTNCNDIANVLSEGSLPSGYTTTNGTAITANGDTASCTVTQASTSNTGTFTLIGAGI